MPQPQLSLKVAPPPVTVTAPSAQVMQELTQRWNGSATGLFDWGDRSALMAEIDLVNRAQGVLDEAATKIAPSVLRIVLTVKEHLPDPKAQRAFLGEHLQLDFRRVSELCIVADSFRLIDPQQRTMGEREIERYGWSIALKLAYVRDPHDRADLWQRACAGRTRAAYRDVLEAIRNYCERKLIGAPSPAQDDAGEDRLLDRLGNAREAFTHFDALTQHLRGPKDYEAAVETLEKLQKELNRIRRTLRGQMEAADHRVMATTA
ncbi:MAG TPA: hypothetical protein VF678_02425 [bacterium]